MARLESDKIMFEIYREAGYDRRYRVVYFTELSERSRDLEIGRALAGEHVLDGFIALEHGERAKALIAALLERLNAGEAVSREELAAALAEIAA
ncbi:hypothetical protein FJ251_04755 [bacterium]|nr:hypothetical protein [bacterium]